MKAVMVGPSAATLFLVAHVRPIATLLLQPRPWTWRFILHFLLLGFIIRFSCWCSSQKQKVLLIISFSTLQQFLANGYYAVFVENTLWFLATAGSFPRRFPRTKILFVIFLKVRLQAHIWQHSWIWWICLVKVFLLEPSLILVRQIVCYLIIAVCLSQSEFTRSSFIECADRVGCVNCLCSLFPVILATEVLESVLDVSLLLSLTFFCLCLLLSLYYFSVAL